SSRLHALGRKARPGWSKGTDRSPSSSPTTSKPNRSGSSHPHSGRPAALRPEPAHHANSSPGGSLTPGPATRAQTARAALALRGEVDVAFALNKGCTILDASSKRFAVPTRRSSKYAVVMGTL